ncbi:hypothetical protein ALC53_07244 [Atta colombica]|uniref:Uncharacterized protein n=1 Tax=Atta colombica TaxID=520822 RepID=A0A195BDF7_9HYME|nr:hypothetical protein ALC53_07244 [Atta colombica]
MTHLCLWKASPNASEEARTIDSRTSVLCSPVRAAIVLRFTLGCRGFITADKLRLMELISAGTCYIIKCFFLRTLMPSKTSLAAEFQAHTKLGSNAVSCIPRSLLSPRVLLHRLVSASRVPSRFRYNRRRRAYVCDIYTCIDSTITRTVA